MREIRFIKRVSRFPLNVVPRNARSRDRDSLSRVRRSRLGNERRVELDDLERNGISGCLLDREKQEFFAIRSSKLIFDRILIKSIENDIGRIDRNGEMKRMEDFASIHDSRTFVLSSR